MLKKGPNAAVNHGSLEGNADDGTVTFMTQGSTTIRIFLVSGHTILLWGLQQLISSHQPGTQLVGSAASTAELPSVIAAAAPDIILVDLDLPDVRASGIVALATCSPAKVLVLTRHDDQALADKAVLEGARGVLKRHATPANFIDAICKVHEGQIWLDRAATGRIMVELSRRQTGELVNKKSARISNLTTREKRIIASILEHSGDSAKTLANKLHISESTLRNHLTAIYSKLGISNRFELISYVHKNNLQQTLYPASA